MRPITLIRVRAALAVVVAVVAIALLLALPREAVLPGDWRSPVMSLEFAGSALDLAWLAGPAAEGARRAVELGHRIDAAFAPLYAGVLVVHGLWLRRSRPRLGAAVALFGLAACPMDWWENAVIGQIVAGLRAGALPEGALDSLRLATTLKWGALGAAFAGLAVADDHRLGRVLAGMGALTTALALATVDPGWCEAMGVAFAGWFGLLLGRSLWALRTAGSSLDRSAAPAPPERTSADPR